MKPYYEDPHVTIYHGDCLEMDLAAFGANVLVTDPPYGIGWSRKFTKSTGNKAQAGIANDQDTTARDRVIEQLKDIQGIVFGSFYAPFPAGLKQVLVWHKPGDSGVYGSTTGYRRDAEPIFLIGKWPKRLIDRSSVIKVSGGISVMTQETGHPHTKPLALMTQLIDFAALGRIIDPFMGSGTTLRAAKNLGLYAIGIELEERWCEVAAIRCSQEILGL